MASPRSPLATAAAVALAVVLGCGGQTPTFDASARYTPDSLAQELVFRYKALRPAAKARPTSRAASKKGAVEGKEQGKSAEATKEAGGPSTLDGLLADVARNAGKIEGTSRADAIRKVAALVSTDGTLKDSDKQELAEALKRLADVN